MNLIEKILLESELDGEDEFDINLIFEPNSNQVQKYKKELERRKKILDSFTKEIKLGLKKINKAYENKQWKSEEEELFLESFYNCRIKYDLEDIPITIYIIKNDNYITALDLEYKRFWYDRDLAWKNFGRIFHWNLNKIQSFIKTMINKYFKLENFDVFL